MDKDFTLKLWTLAVAMYEESDGVGIPLHKRPVTIRDAWREAARKELANYAPVAAAP